MADSPKSDPKEIHTDPETGRMSSAPRKAWDAVLSPFRQTELEAG